MPYRSVFLLARVRDRVLRAGLAAQPFALKKRLVVAVGVVAAGLLAWTPTSDAAALLWQGSTPAGLAGAHRSRQGHPVIDITFPLSEVSEAIRYLEGGRAQGKLAITV